MSIPEKDFARDFWGNSGIRKDARDIHLVVDQGEDRKVVTKDVFHSYLYSMLPLTFTGKPLSLYSYVFLEVEYLGIPGTSSYKTELVSIMLFGFVQKPGCPNSL
jgi:hypothetical protein